MSVPVDLKGVQNEITDCSRTHGTSRRPWLGPVGTARCLGWPGSASCGRRELRVLRCWRGHPDAGHQSFDGSLYLSPHAMAQISQPPEEFSRGPYVAAGMGRNHLLAIRPDGTIAIHPDPDDSAAPPTGSFKAVTGGNTHSVALHTDGRVTVWGSGPAVVAGAPAGMLFDAIAARGSYTLALAKDGDVYGWGANPIFSSSFGWTLNEAGHHFIAPREVGRSYTKVAAGLSPVMGQGLIAALRDDRPRRHVRFDHRFEHEGGPAAHGCHVQGRRARAGVRRGRLDTRGTCTHGATMPGLVSWPTHPKASTRW